MLKKMYRALLEGKFLIKTWKYLGKVFRKIVSILDFQIARPIRYIYVMRQKIVPNRIVFSAVDDRYDCNPKYITEEILKRRLPYEIVWIQGQSEKKAPELYPAQIKVVQRGTVEAIDALATSKIWIENELKFLKPYLVHKKKGQVYIQTWHGSMGFKKIGRANLYNQAGRKKLFITKVAKRCDQATSYCISNSQFETNVFREGYWDHTPILMLGHARNDILLSQDPEQLRAIREKVLTFYGLMPSMPADFAKLSLEQQEEILKKRKEAMETKYLLYAPTYRTGLSLQYFDIDFARLIRAQEKRFGGVWKIILRYHLHNRNIGEKLASSPLFINATNYPDMQELLSMADAGISDYSSWLCDYVLTGRPAYIYAADYEQYANDRGFYYPLDTTPFPIAKNNDDLESAILQFDMEQYQKGCKKFLQDRGCVENGKATKKIVDFIEELMA